jgi:hypothetical protein
MALELSTIQETEKVLGTSNDLSISEVTLNRKVCPICPFSRAGKTNQHSPAKVVKSCFSLHMAARIRLVKLTSIEFSSIAGCICSTSIPIRC